MCKKLQVNGVVLVDGAAYALGRINSDCWWVLLCFLKSFCICVLCVIWMTGRASGLCKYFWLDTLVAEFLIRNSIGLCHATFSIIMQCAEFLYLTAPLISWFVYWLFVWGLDYTSLVWQASILKNVHCSCPQQPVCQGMRRNWALLIAVTLCRHIEQINFAY